MRKIGAVIAVLLFSFSASAQRLDESIEISLVNVDVHVTDKKGNRVTGLRAEDFEVRDGGKVQAITNFSELAPSTSEGTVSIERASAAQTPPRQRRTVVLFIEPVTLASFRTKELFDSIRTLLHETVAKGDQVSLVTFRRSMELLVPFTDDLTAIETSLAELERQMSGAEGTVFEESSEMMADAIRSEQEFVAAMGETGIEISRGSGVSNALIAPARRQRFLIQQKALALESLMQSISGADGKKIVIMAMRRFGLYAGAEFFGGVAPESFKQELDTVDYRDSLIRTANAHGITIYPIHPQGMAPALGDSESLNSAIVLNETAALHEVAVATGGLTASGTANIAKLFPRIHEDLDAYYSIGYRTPATRQDVTRKIVVKAKNPDYVVRSRRQFVEKSDVTEMKDRVVANLYQKVDSSSSGIPFDVAVGTIKQQGRNRWTVPLEVKVPIQALTALERGNAYNGEFSVYIATGSSIGVMSEVDRKSQTYQIPAAELKKAQGSHFTYQFDMTVDKLANRLSIGVMDEVGKEYGMKRFALPGR